MITAGDEVSRTQQGNNNAYCQDNEINWHDWYWDDAKWRLLNFTKKLIRLRREHPIFRRRDFFHGVAVGDGGRKDVAWLKPDGTEMSDEDWNDGNRKHLGMWLHGEQIPETDDRGQPVQDASYLAIFNADPEAVEFKLPDAGEGAKWIVEVDTAHENGEPPGGAQPPNGSYKLEGRSLALIRQGEGGSAP
jgi:glycogen operon protein